MSELTEPELTRTRFFATATYVGRRDFGIMLMKKREGSKEEKDGEGEGEWGEAYKLPRPLYREDKEREKKKKDIFK